MHGSVVEWSGRREQDGELFLKHQGGSLCCKHWQRGCRKLFSLTPLKSRPDTERKERCSVHVPGLLIKALGKQFHFIDKMVQNYRWLGASSTSYSNVVLGAQDGVWTNVFNVKLWEGEIWGCRGLLISADVSLSNWLLSVVLQSL